MRLKQFFLQLEALPSKIIQNHRQQAKRASPSTISSSVDPPCFKLPTILPDLNSVQQYLGSTNCHLFSKSPPLKPLMDPVAHSVKSLDKATQELLYSMWPVEKPSVFKRHVEVYKACFLHILQLPDTTDQRTVYRRGQALARCLDMMYILNQVNERNNQIVACQTFAVPELGNHVNIHQDYIIWSQNKNLNHMTFTFFSFPFLYTTAAKTSVLRTKFAIQQDEAVKAQVNSFEKMFYLWNPFFQIAKDVTFQVNRKNVVEETMELLRITQHEELKKPLVIIFEDDRAGGGGGVTTEFLNIVLREMMGPEFGLFQMDEFSLKYWFNPTSKSENDLERYHMIGMLYGLAIYNSSIIHMALPLALYKKLLNRSVDLDDFRELMPVDGRGLQDLLNFEGDQFASVFMLAFEHWFKGEASPVSLCPGGEDKDVEQSNKQEYVDLKVDLILNKSVKEQFQAFKEGLFSICGSDTFEFLQPEELRLLVEGTEEYDFMELEKNTKYEDFYHRDHEVIVWFWEVLHEMSLQEKQKFLKFLTANDRVPASGMKDIKITIKPSEGGTHYPYSHTCLSMLRLPQYEDKATMRERLLFSINQTEGLGLPET